MTKLVRIPFLPRIKPGYQGKPGGKELEGPY